MLGCYVPTTGKKGTRVGLGVRVAPHRTVRYGWQLKPMVRSTASVCVFASGGVYWCGCAPGALLLGCSAEYHLQIA